MCNENKPMTKGVGIGMRFPVRRSKAGCFCCRLRKKKCDERKPVCTGCTRARLLCSWPSGAETGTGESEFAWRIKMRSGGAVTMHPTAARDASSSSSNPSSQMAIPKTKRRSKAPDFDGMTMTLCFSVPRSTNDLIKSQSCRNAFEYYQTWTSPLMIARDCVQNPYIHAVLPIAHTDSLIMHSVLALGGIHAGHALQSAEARQVGSQHYILAVGELKTALTAWVDGSYSDLLRLFLASILMCQYECITGNTEGALFHHLRACREFVTHAINLGPEAGDQDSLNFLLEVYVYFELLGALRSPSHEYTRADAQSLQWCLESLAHHQKSGFIIGCAIDLYRLIPIISQFGALCQREKSGEEGLGCQELYETLQACIAQWQPPSEDTNASSLHNWSDGDITAAAILQNTLMIVVEVYYHHNPFWVDSFIDHTLTLLRLVNGEVAAVVTFWPTMIIGCCTRSEEQQAAVCELLQQKQEKSRLPILDRAIEVLGWVWEEARRGGLGLHVLDKVLKMRDTDLCLG